MINLKDAEVNRRIPKNRFSFDTSPVDTIIWKYKLSKDTTNLTDSEQYKELQVILVNFKDKVDTKVFLGIQNAIPYNILFIAEDNYYMVIDGNLLQTSEKLIDNRILHIDAFNIRGVVVSIVELITGIKSTDISCAVAKYMAVQKLTKQIEQLINKMYKEVQPKKKFEMHEELNLLKQQLEELK